MTTMIAWESRKLYKPKKISAREKTSRRTTRHYVALGAGLEPDCPGLRGRKKPELYQICKSREESKMMCCLEMALTRLAKIKKQDETKMIQCLEVTLYQSPKSRTKKKQFTEDSYFTLCIHLSPLQLFLNLPFCTLLDNKKEKKNVDYIFIHWYCCLFFPV